MPKQILVKKFSFFSKKSYVDLAPLYYEDYSENV